MHTDRLGRPQAGAVVSSWSTSSSLCMSLGRDQCAGTTDGESWILDGHHVLVPISKL